MSLGLQSPLKKESSFRTKHGGDAMERDDPSPRLGREWKLSDDKKSQVPPTTEQLSKAPLE